MKFIIFLGLSTKLLAAQVYPKPPEMPYYYPPEYRIVSGVSVSSSSTEVELDDGSIWSAKSLSNRLIASTWKRGDLVHFAYGILWGDYTFKNNRAHSEVPMIPITRPNPANDHTYIITEIHLQHLIILTSNSGARLSYIVSSPFHFWRVGDCISIGSGARDQDSCGFRTYTSYLYNWRKKNGLPAYLE